MNWQSGEPIPALCVHPPAAANLDEAHAAIEQWEHYSRKRLDPAQRLAVEHILAIRSNGMWAARTTGRAVSRQNGKGEEIEVAEAWDLTQRGAPIVHTAHEIPTATKAHLRMVGHLQSHRDLRRLIRKVRASNSDRSIEMVNGGIIVYRTRTAGGGRGLDDIARLVVDEAQHAQPEQLAASTPILAVNPNPQTNFMGSAGIEGRSEQWWELRKRALVGDVRDFAWLEHSAEQVSMVDGKLLSVRPNSADVAAWIVANHGYPERVSADFLAEQLRLLGPQLFAREHLCVWDPPTFGAGLPIEPAAFVALMSDDLVRPDGLPDFFLDVSPGMRSASIGIAGGSNPLILDVERDAGTRWLISRAAELKDVYPGAGWFCEAAGAVGALLPALEAVGIEPQQFTGPDMGRACGHLQKLVADRAVRIVRDDGLSGALAGAMPRDVGEGLWAWGRRKSSVDISPLVAVTGAAWGHMLAANPPAEIFI